MIKFFGKIDMNKQGRIASEIPAWAMTTHIEELQEDIARKERGIERGETPLDAIPQTKEEIRREKEKLLAILESRPKLSDVEKNKVYKAYKELSSEIKNSLFTRSEMKLGLVSPHEEAKRMKDPIIKVSKDVAELCEVNQIKITLAKDGNYVSRDGATKIWKIIGRYFGEPSNVEVLRRDKATQRTGA